MFLLHSSRHQGSQRRRYRCWICSGLGGWQPGLSTCASRYRCLSSLPNTSPVVQCDHVLLRPLLRLHLPLQRGALHELHAQVGPPFQRIILPLSVLIEIPGYIFCILVMDSWGRRPILSFCQVQGSKALPFTKIPLKMISGIACIFCGLLQGQEDSDLKNLQVKVHQVLMDDSKLSNIQS